MKRSFSQLCCALACLASSTTTLIADVSIQELIPPEGFSGLYARRLSDDGTAIVGHLENTAGPAAFKWTKKTGLQILGPGDATDVSSSGGVVVGYWNHYEPEACIWLPNRQAFAVHTYPTAVSGDGSVIVGDDYAYICTVGVWRGFHWSAQTDVVVMGSLRGWCGTVSSASNVSTDGSTVVGYSYTANNGPRAFRQFRAVSSMEDLGALDGGSSSASDVNSDGSVVVGWSSSASGGRAFRWTSASGMQDLGVSPGSTNSSAAAVNPAGTVVVGSSGGRAAIWREGMGMVDLAVFLSAQGLDLSGWELTEAFGVSADGSVIAGFGARAGVGRNWIVSGIAQCNPIGSSDVNDNGIADSCELDCNANGLPDGYEIAQQLAPDCNSNGRIDSCEIFDGSVTDCDGNTWPDSCDIAVGAASDYDSNGLPDSCQCLADLFVDHQVNGADLGILLSQWGAGGGAVADINRDGYVNGADLGILLSSWGACP